MKYTMVYDGDSFIDGIDYDTLEAAIASAPSWWAMAENPPRAPVLWQRTCRAVNIG